MVPFWDRVDAVVEGIEGMRDAGEEFLPKYVDEAPQDYRFRLQCTTMTNVYVDNVEGLAGKPFEQPIALKGEVPEEITLFAADVDGSGNSMSIFAGATFFNGINNALDWILVDYDKRDPDAPAPRNRAEEKALNLRPHWSHVLARNVIDAQSVTINGKEVIRYLKVLEPGEPDHIREFNRDDNGVVTWTLYQYQDQMVGTGSAATHFVAIDGGTMTIDEIPAIPFVTGRRVGRSWKVDPPLKNALDKQIDLYQDESDLKFAKKLTAFPMLAANGMVPDKNGDGSPKKLGTGPGRVLWGKADPNSGAIGSWSYVEPNAESLKFLAAENAATRQELRELLKQPLTAQSGNITVITAMVAAGKAKSAVKAWALVLQDALENALALTAKWMGIDYDPTVQVYINFDDYTEGEDLTALQTMRAAKDLSRRTYWSEMGRRGVLSSNFDPEAEEMELLEELPGDPTASDVSTSDAP